MLAGTHDPKSIVVLFDALRIEGFTSDGITSYERLSEASTELGADGFVSVVRETTTAKILTLTLYGNSPGYRILSETYAAERAARGTLPTHTLHVENLVSGDTITDGEAVLLEGPILDEGANAGPRSFRFLLPDPEEQFAKNIVA